MNIERIVESAEMGDISWMVRNAFRTGLLLGRYEQKLDEYGKAFPDVAVNVDGPSISAYPQTREELTKFLEVFGGDWEKSVESWRPDKMQYSQKVVVCGVELRVQAVSDPPPSCQIVEEEVEIPARREKRRRIVCPQPEGSASA